MGFSQDFSGVPGLTTSALNNGGLAVGLLSPQDTDEGDIASISTETEDDPVNLAMRATLGEGSSVGDDDEGRADEVDDEEEVILWGRG